MMSRKDLGLTRLLPYPLALPVSRPRSAASICDGAYPDLPSNPYTVETLFYDAVLHLRRLVEGEGRDLDSALCTVIAERMLGLAQINRLEAQARARYAAPHTDATGQRIKYDELKEFTAKRIG